MDEQTSVTEASKNALDMVINGTSQRERIHEQLDLLIDGINNVKMSIDTGHLACASQCMALNDQLQSLIASTIIDVASHAELIQEAKLTRQDL